MHNRAGVRLSQPSSSARQAVTWDSAPSGFQSLQAQLVACSKVDFLLGCFFSRGLKRKRGLLADQWKACHWTGLGLPLKPTPSKRLSAGLSPRPGHRRTSSRGPLPSGAPYIPRLQDGSGSALVQPSRLAPQQAPVSRPAWRLCGSPCRVEACHLRSGCECQGRTPRPLPSVLPLAPGAREKGLLRSLQLNEGPSRTVLGIEFDCESPVGRFRESRELRPTF